MLGEFARFVADLFPSIDATNARAFLDKVWKKDPPWLDLYATLFPPELCQGDILRPITFIVQDDQGEFGEIVAPGMILSHSCDIENDENIVFAACRPFSLFRSHRSVGDIKNNTFFGALYLQSVPTLGDLVVDFSIVQSVRAKRLKQGFSDGAVTRVSSFTHLGYYFLVAKLTVRFLRPQPENERRGSAEPPFARRLKQVSRDAFNSGKYLVFGSRNS